MKKLLLLLLSLALCACLAACGDDDDDDREKKNNKKNDSVAATETPTPAETDPTPEATPTEAPAITIASTETWGDFTVGVPEGWTFRKGDVFDEEDTRYCSVKKSDFSYFDLKMQTENIATQQYAYNKNTYTNEQVDITVNYGGISWTGFQYSDGWGGYGFELIGYAGDDNKIVRISSCGFAYDSEAAKTVLGSLVIK